MNGVIHRLLPVLIVAACVALPATKTVNAQQPPPGKILADTYNSPQHKVFEFTVPEDGTLQLRYIWDDPARVFGMPVKPGQLVHPGDLLCILKVINADKNVPPRTKAHLKAGMTYRVKAVNHTVGEKIRSGEEEPLMVLQPMVIAHDSTTPSGDGGIGLEFQQMLVDLWESTGLRDLIAKSGQDWVLGLGKIIMIVVGVGLLYLGIFYRFEPLLLVPIGFGAIMTNIPIANLAGPDGILGYIYQAGVANGVFPLLIFMGVGALTDFGPLIAHPKTAILGAAAQAGIFTALLGALALTVGVPGIDFSLADAASIGIIGGADGPTSIFVASQLSPSLLGAVAVAAYSYMALVPIIQPPIMKALTTKKERQVRMVQLREVSRLEKIFFPLGITLLCALFIPEAAPLISMLMFGNLMRECGVVNRLTDTTQNALINGVTIMLGLAVGSKLAADKFLTLQTIGILVLGLFAFCVGTVCGLLIGKVMHRVTRGKVNPLIGASGVSAVPMSARVVNKVGMDEDPHNFLLMHAMGPNVAGVIGSAAAAGVLLNALRLVGGG